MEVAFMRIFTKLNARKEYIEQSNSYKKLMEVFEETLQILPVGILIYEENTVVCINKEFKALLGNIQDTDAVIIDNFHHLFTSKAHNTDEVEITFNSKLLMVLTKKVSSRIMYVVTDISAIQKLSLKEVQEQFKEKLMLSFIHEFKTPLNWLSGSLRSIMPDIDNTKTIQMARHATSMLQFYIDDMLYFNMPKDHIDYEDTSISLSKCIKECLQFINFDLKCNSVSCKYSLADNLRKRVSGNPTRYKQIVINILNNCIKSCPKGDGIIKISLCLKEQSIYTTISDNGIKLSDDELSLLLNPIENTRQKCLQIRFGLGMLLCKSMCQKCKGDLYINSSESGTIYSFFFPYKSIEFPNESSSKEEKKDSTKTQDNKDAGHHLKKSEHLSAYTQANCVLIVDDTPFNNVILAQMLKTLKISCHSCINGKEALDKFMGGYKCALILMDINMPVMDGIEVYPSLGHQENQILSTDREMQGHPDRRAVGAG
jgi:osomolarity two-component system sensor histidine kinase TcsA